MSDVAMVDAGGEKPVDNSPKGKTFVEADLSKREIAAAQARLGDKYAAWLEEKLAGLNEKYRVVAIDEATGEKVIAEELEQKAINTLPDAIRSIVGTVASLPPALRLDVLSAFDEAGSIRHSFKLIE